ETGRPIGGVRADPARDRVRAPVAGRLLRAQPPRGNLLPGPGVVERELSGVPGHDPVRAAVAEPADGQLAGAAHRADERGGRQGDVAAARGGGDLADGSVRGGDRGEGGRLEVVRARADRVRQRRTRGPRRCLRRDVAGGRGGDPVAYDGDDRVVHELEVERV